MAGEVAVEDAVVLRLVAAFLMQVDHELGHAFFFWPPGAVLLAAVVAVNWFAELLAQPLVLAVQFALQNQ